MPEAEPTETIHLYIVKEEAEQVVDSTASAAPTTLHPQPLVSPSQSRHGHLVPYLIIATHLLIVLCALFAQLYISLTETATIIIVPKSYYLATQLTLANVESRVFQPLTLTQSKTVRATGTGHQDATAASGTITLYNASIQEQTIDAGTLLIGSDGVHIITDQPTAIPGATPPLEGQTTVTAHAVNKGAAGNIHAGDIQGACCRENIFAYNSAFSGGQDERTYPMVTQHDITSAVSSVAPILLRQITTSFQRQLRWGETRTPNLCSEHIAPDRTVGEEATQVTVTISESCQAGAYTTTDLQAKVRQALGQRAEQSRGKGYQLASSIQTTRLQATIQQGRLVLIGTFQGRLVYHYSTRELTTLRRQLAGKSRQQAGTILSHLSGAEHITVQLEKNGTFPTDPTHIHIQFLQVL